MIVNHIGEIVALKLTNVDDRKLVTEMAYTLFRKLCGYRSYNVGFVQMSWLR
ncbi:transposase [Pseudoalteromonas piscicida]|nr:transposase [Pseudoalteromonas piscicida]